MRLLRNSRTVLACLAALFAGAAEAHEGHDHAAPPPPVSNTIAPRADASSNDFEVVAIARGDRLRLYLDSFKSNEPVKDAVIEVDTPGGTLTAATDREGAYEVSAPWLARPGIYDLAITVQASGLVDVLTATLTIVAPPSSPETTLGGMWQRIQSFAVSKGSGLGLWAVAGLAFLGGFVVSGLLRRWRTKAIAALAVLAAFAAAPDRVEAADTQPDAAVDIVMAVRDVAQRFPDGAVFVPKPTQRILSIRTLLTDVQTYSLTVELPGRIIPDPNGSGFVQASVSGRLTPPPGGFPRLGTRVTEGDVLAFVQPAVAAADITSQQQQARELDQQIALAERKLERFRQIQGVIARAQIEDADLELSGLRKRRANLDRALRDQEKLVAPVSGVVAAVQAVAGQIAEPNAIIFQIVDPSRYWVEALSYEAYALKEQATGRLGDNRTVPLLFRGAGLADRNQAIPIQFSIEGGTSGLRAGQLLTVLASTNEERRGIAVPRGSVLRGPNGQSIVYEHTNAERFVPREVRVEPLDGQRVLIVSGIEAGKRIVTQGAELLNQIR
ncbi:MAG: efflux RND transporter periplasmic adaptor subunit [Reyranella sp.]|nr:efflux RND transporter periplasmic adaptor subunit [Reyranella sp.]